MHGRPEDVLSLAELCAELGVSARSLQLICQEFAGMGVMQYVRAQRMKEVTGTNTLDSAVISAIREQGQKRNFKFE